MNYFKLIFLFVFCFVFCTVVAQNIQTGYVKTKGRLDKNGQLIPGQRLSGVCITTQNGQTVVTGINGEFTLAIPGKNFYLRNVQKQGYELVDPEMLRRQYVCSANPLIITMETPERMTEDRLKSERILRHSLQQQLLQREHEIDSLKENNIITEEKYYQALQKLYAEQESSEKLSSNMAKMYAEIDYDLLDELNRQVSFYIKNGDLIKVDSLLHSGGRREELLTGLLEQRQQEKRQDLLEQANQINEQKKQDLIQDCTQLIYLFTILQKYDTVVSLLDLRASFDTTDFQLITLTGDDYLNLLYNDNKAVSYYKRALEIADREKNSNYKHIIVALQKIGNVYLNQNNYKWAVDQFNQALTLIENHDIDSISLGKTLIYLGIANNGMKRFGEALEFYREALGIYNNLSGLDVSTSIADIYNNMGITYENMGVTYENKKDIKKALQYYETSLNMRISTYGGDHEKIAASYSNIASVYTFMGEYEQAINYYLKSVDIYKKSKRNYLDVALIYNNLGATYYDMDDFEKALTFFEKALDIMQIFLPDDHPDRKTLMDNIAIIKSEMK